MAINFLDPETTEVSHGNIKVAGPLSSLSKSELATLLKTSKDVTGIELRMLPPLIKDNHTTAVWPFPGFSKLYCLTIVVSDVPNQTVGASGRTKTLQLGTTKVHELKTQKNCLSTDNLNGRHQEIRQ